MSLFHNSSNTSALPSTPGHSLPPLTADAGSTPTPSGFPTTPDSNRSSQNGGHARQKPHRYSALDTKLFPNFPQNTSSPSQAKRALEAHLLETDRRLDEAGQLGTGLIQQKRILTDRLKEIERLQDERELGPELRQKLVELEREYNELGRDSARAFMGSRRSGVGSESDSGLSQDETALGNMVCHAMHVVLDVIDVFDGARG